MSNPVKKNKSKQQNQVKTPGLDLTMVKPLFVHDGQVIIV